VTSDDVLRTVRRYFHHSVSGKTTSSVV
jgi:hypothetical protein